MQEKVFYFSNSSVAVNMGRLCDYRRSVNKKRPSKRSAAGEDVEFPASDINRPGTSNAGQPEKQKMNDGQQQSSATVQSTGSKKKAQSFANRLELSDLTREATPHSINEGVASAPQDSDGLEFNTNNGEDVEFPANDINRPGTANGGQLEEQEMNDGQRLSSATVQSTDSKKNARSFVYRMEFNRQGFDFSYKSTAQSNNEGVASAPLDSDCLGFDSSNAVVSSDNGNLDIHISIYKE